MLALIKMQRNILIGFLSIAAVLLVSGWVWYRFVETPAAPVSSYSIGEETPGTVLRKDNKDYALAKNYQAGGNYDLALQFYQKALPEAQDDFQRTQILFNIAYANELLKNYKDAIAQFKAIAADPKNYAIARAAAVQNVGLMYYTYSGSTTLQTIFTETFKDSPYDSFAKDNSVNLAYTKLFEYAASIYPLAASELRIAYGYSDELLNVLHGATTTPQGKEYLAIITQSLQAADRDLLRMQNVPEEKTLIPEILVREGKTFDRLATLGVVDSQRAEPYFERGVQYASSLGVKPGSYHVLNYAGFLADRYGATRSADIKKLLVPFRAGNEANIYSAVIDFYKNTRANPASDRSKKFLIKLGKIDVDFQKYLISLGWTSADFK